MTWATPADAAATRGLPRLDAAELADFHAGQHAASGRRRAVSVVLAAAIYLSFLLSDAVTVPDLEGLAWAVRLPVAVLLLLTWPVSTVVQRRGLDPGVTEVWFGVVGVVVMGSQSLLQALTVSPSGSAFFIGCFPTLVFYVAAVWTRLSVTVVTLTSMTAVGAIGVYASSVVTDAVKVDATLTLVGTAIIVVVLAFRREVDERTNYLLRAGLADLGNRDALTQLPNRRALDEALRRWDEGRSWGLMAMVDVDRFKALNDTFGHPAGDAALAALAQVLSGALRTVDGGQVMRYGGEEFTVVIPGISEEGAAVVAERLRAQVEDARPDGREVTVSIGWAWCPRSHPLAAPTMLALADDAVLQAKRTGRNRAVRANAPARAR